MLLGEVDNYESLFFTRSWHGIGSLEMRINRYKKHVDKLIKGNIIFPFADVHKAFIIRHREIELDENGKITENWKIHALPLKSFVSQRITVPPEKQEFDKVDGDSESIMKHYVDRHLVNPLDLKRKLPNLVIADNQHRGSQASWLSRFVNLSEEVSNLSLFSGLGWNIYLDLENKQFVFDVYEGNDLTSNQDTLPPVMFSPDFDSIKQMAYLESDLNYKNTAYVGGPGESVGRIIEEVGVGVGVNRFEIFLDARNVETEIPVPEGEEGEPTPRSEDEVRAEVRAIGERELKEYEQEIYLEGQILTKSPFVYEKHYNLGDIVTMQNKDWGVTMDARITEIKEIYETSGFQLEATFGNDRPTIIKKIKQELKQISGEVRR